MKLRSLAVNQFKRFDKPVRLDDIEDGLNILVGPNEMGKSTLLDALRAVLFEKYSSKSQPIVALQNDRNRAAPVVELRFEYEDVDYTITKRFIKKPYARLSCSDGRHLEGDEAESTLRDLLDFDAPGQSGAKPESIGMWHVLWVQQGQSFGPPNLPESARTTLHQALESEVGGVLGGHRGRVLPAVIEQQLFDLITPSKQQPRGAFKDLVSDAERMRQELGELGTQRQELSQTITDLETSESTLKRLTAQTDDKSDQEELDGVWRRHDELAQLETDIANAATEYQLRQRKLERVQNAKDARDQLKEEISSQKSEVAATEEDFEALRGQEDQLSSQVAKLSNRAKKSEQKLKDADDEVTRYRRTLAAVERQRRIRELKKNLKQAQKAERRQRDARTAAAAILVTEKSIKAIRGTQKVVESMQGRLDAAATVVRFEMNQEGLSGIEVDGRALAGGRPFIRVVEPADIKVPDRGRIKVEPAIADRETLLQQYRNASMTLQQALEEVGVKSTDEAEQQFTDRQALLKDENLAGQETELYAPETEDHGAGSTALAAHVEGLEQVLKRELLELEVSNLPERREAEKVLRSAEQISEKARDEHESTSTSLSGRLDRLSSLRIEIGEYQGRLGSVFKNLQKLEDQLAKAQQKRSDKQLSAELKAASDALTEQETAVRELQGQKGDETLDLLKARISRLQKAQQSKRKKISDLRETIAGLSSKIEVAEATGIDEAIAEKERQLELTNAEKDQKERDVAILSLLRSTLRDAEYEAKERYLSPVISRVKPYLQLLFPSANIHIDENLHISSIERADGYEESFERLSFGTQEQIAILVRLAFAEMLSERGYPSTVILDDSLVFSDDERISDIFDILNVAAEKFQVIVLTCREQLFEGIGGTNLSLVPIDRDKLISA